MRWKEWEIPRRLPLHWSPMHVNVSVFFCHVALLTGLSLSLCDTLYLCFSSYSRALTHSRTGSKDVFVSEKGYNFVYEIPFDSDRKMMSVVYGRFVSFSSGGSFRCVTSQSFPPSSWFLMRFVVVLFCAFYFCLFLFFFRFVSFRFVDLTVTVLTVTWW